MKKIIIYLLPVLLLASSCKKWLDVKPESQVAADQLFTTSSGFEEALDGIYTRCSQKDAYGLELTMGLPDVIAQNWVITPSADYLNYLQSFLYNYKAQNFINKRDAIWQALYNAIANTNLLLNKLDSNKVLADGEFTLIKGEALALRAYLHFDALRLFAPSYASKSSAVVIPYVSTFSNKVTPASSVADIVKFVIKDLSDAKALLKQSDPILGSGYIADYPSKTSAELSSPTLFLQNRRHRLNYYAVCGELSRAYLYMNDKPNALTNALEVIDSGKFPWTQASDFNNSDPKLKDRILYKELLFAWYIPTEGPDLINYFGNSTNGLSITPDMGASIYETNTVGAQDLRWSQWFTPGTFVLMNKYKRDPDSNLHPLVAPALRLSEMYYIAAECTYASNPTQATAYIDAVRQARHISTSFTVSSADDFLTQLVKEARKEFYGEGQLFYMYKRLNRGIVGQTGIINAPTDATFVLPLPDNEIEFGGR